MTENRLQAEPSTNDVAKQAPRSQGFTELGVSGLRRQGGVVLDEVIRMLRGPRGRKIYREMSSSDDMVRALLRAIEMLLRNMDWRVDPADDGAEAKGDAEYLEEVKDDMSHTWEDFIAEVLSFLIYGWDWHEIVYKRRQGHVRNKPGMSSKFNDGKIGIRKLAPRAQMSLDRWEFDDSGGIQGMWQRDPNKPTQPVLIPIEKSLHFKAGPHGGNPEGESVLRGCYIAWYHKKKIRTIQSIQIERDGTGIAVFGVPPEIMAANAHPDDRAIFLDAQDMVSNLRRDEQDGIVMPNAYDPETGNPLYTIELLSSPGTRAVITLEVLKDLDRAIANVFLGDFMMVGHEATGSFALHSDKTALFAVALGAWGDSIQEVLNRHLVPRLFALNGWEREQLPRFVHGDIESVDLKLLSEIIADLAGAGMPLFPEPALDEHIRELMHFPPPEQPIVVPQPVLPGAPPNQPAAGADAEAEEAEPTNALA